MVKDMDSTKTMEEMAKKNMEVALSQLDGSEKEVKEIETFLKEAKKRYENIDADEDEEEDSPQANMPPINRRC